MEGRGPSGDARRGIFKTVRARASAAVAVAVAVAACAAAPVPSATDGKGGWVPGAWESMSPSEVLDAWESLSHSDRLEAAAWARERERDAALANSDSPGYRGPLQAWIEDGTPAREVGFDCTFDQFRKEEELSFRFLVDGEGNATLIGDLGVGRIPFEVRGSNTKLILIERTATGSVIVTSMWDRPESAHNAWKVLGAAHSRHIVGFSGEHTVISDSHGTCTMLPGTPAR